MLGAGAGVKISNCVKTDEFRLNNLNKLTNEQFPQHVAEKVALLWPYCQAPHLAAIQVCLGM